MTLLSGDKGLKKAKENQDIVLDFLVNETWTRVDIVQDLLGFKSVQGAYKVLKNLEKMDLVRRFSLPIMSGRSLTIWGITTHGLGMAFKGGWDDRPAFSPSRVRLSSAGHHLGLQSLRVKFINAGWSWSLGNRVPHVKGRVYPDAIAVRSDGLKIAVEYERTLKSLKRYREILVSHLAARKDGLWEGIWYISPSELVDRLSNAFHSIGHAKFQGERFQIEEGHLEPFSFKSESDLSI